MRVLVTGATGFVGGNVATALRAGCLDVIGVARREAEGIVETADLANAAQVQRMMASIRPEAIVHAAGQRHGDFRSLAAANIAATRNLLASAATLSARPKIVLIGSAAEYGPQARPGPIAEDAHCVPRSAYGRSKLAATRIGAWYSKADCLHVTTLRVFNVVGPGAGGLFGAIVRKLAGGEGDVEGVDDPPKLADRRDFVRIADVAEACRLALLADAAPGIVNVCTGHARSFGALKRQLQALAGVAVDAVPTGETNAGDAVIGDPGLAARSLGLRPNPDLTDMLAAAIEAERKSH